MLFQTNPKTKSPSKNLQRKNPQRKIQAVKDFSMKIVIPIKVYIDVIDFCLTSSERIRKLFFTYLLELKSAFFQ